MPMQILRRLFGHSPQSVADFSDQLQTEDSIVHEAAAVERRAQEPSSQLDLQKCKGFQDLPDELLEIIFLHLEKSSSSRKYFFAICGVCRSWRNLGQRLFFSTPWNTPHLICHPNQLFCLSPRIPTGSRSGLLRCYVRRENLKSGSRRITMHIGKDPQQTHRSRFLLCAIQRNRQETLIYLNSKCEGIPCARLSRNILSTKYTLVLDPSISVSPSVTGSSSMNGGSSNATGQLDEVVQQPSIITDELDTTTTSTTTTTTTPMNTTTSNNESSNSFDVPTLLLSLHYKARIKGLMQPRRMSVSLPPSDHLLCSNGTLPLLVQHSNGNSCSSSNIVNNNNNNNAKCGIGSNNSSYHGSNRGKNTSNTTTNSSSSIPQQRPHLDQISSVAVRELPQSVINTITAMNTTTMNTNTNTQDGDGAETRPPPPSTTTITTTTTTITTTTKNQHHNTITSLLSLLHRAKTTPIDDTEDPLPITLSNKSPHWNEGLRCWCLNFRGRVKLASVKNFQLVLNDDETQKVIMQFGKVDQDTFILDFNPTVVSAVQAFGIALSTFDGKVML